ncbi:hypothetical protein IQ26_07592 [Mesorhizobium tianshanense]|uniref:Uncharacterized protein n=1 Tax=Mesorhizobium tianshanense TaxID=39844 RepID=A0A562MAZ9_9HYPH|nr:hypothetical protein IQ26_07592 [Mesorhizobium tianshanense]
MNLAIHHTKPCDRFLHVLSIHPYLSVLEELANYLPNRTA